MPLPIVHIENLTTALKIAQDRERRGGGGHSREVIPIAVAKKKRLQLALLHLRSSILLLAKIRCNRPRTSPRPRHVQKKTYFAQKRINGDVPTILGQEGRVLSPPPFHKRETQNCFVPPISQARVPTQTNRTMSHPTGV